MVESVVKSPDKYFWKNLLGVNDPDQGHMADNISR
jgi:hypothetical protein